MFRPTDPASQTKYRSAWRLYINLGPTTVIGLVTIAGDVRKNPCRWCAELLQKPDWAWRDSWQKQSPIWRAHIVHVLAAASIVVRWVGMPCDE